ncbi:MAG: helix-turn-helix transcriptional regulator [Methylacidiphilales bacterium]|nr:helix-turn-helix transcriptional regulator [Candidatus Methylacidiphilales bacterium]NJR18182.1 helix-turn-helix transcriptional regulator [Calothrix sp. CSU_2_0]
MDTNKQESKFTEREQEVLELILEGKSNPIIAQALYISINTVKKHIHNIITKLNAGDDDGNPPPTGAAVPRKPLPNGDGNAAAELSSLLEQRLLS